MATRTGASQRGAPLEALSWMVYWTFTIGLKSLRSLGEAFFSPAESLRPPTPWSLNSEIARREASSFPPTRITAPGGCPARRSRADATVIAASLRTDASEHEVGFA